MVHFIDIDAEHVVGIRIDGKIEEQEFDAVAALIEKRLQEHRTVNIYVELDSFGGMEPKAFLKDLQFGFKYIDRIEKEAVVTGKNWVHKLTQAADKLISSVDFKTFSFQQQEEAKKWVQQ